MLQSQCRNPDAAIPFGDQYEDGSEEQAEAANVRPAAGGLLERQGSMEDLATLASTATAFRAADAAADADVGGGDAGAGGGASHGHAGYCDVDTVAV